MLVTALPGTALALDNGMSSASIGVIEHYMRPNGSGDNFNHSDRPLDITIAVPELVDGDVMAAFYTDGIMTKLMDVDIDEKTLTGNIKFDMTSDGGKDGLPPTPDSIRLYTWDKGNLKPITKSHEILTDEVVAEANREIKETVLDGILGTEHDTGVTAHIRNNWNFTIADHGKIDALLDQMDSCASAAYEKSSSQLLTSEYAIRTFYDDVIDAFNELDTDEAQKQEFMDIYNALSSKHSKVFQRLAHLLCINLDEFI